MKCELQIWHWLTHEVRGHFAHAGAEDEVPHEVWDECEGHAEDTQRQITDGQRQQEQVRDRPHAPVPHQNRDDQAVSYEAQEKDEHIQHDPDRLVHVWRTSKKERCYLTRFNKQTIQWSFSLLRHAKFYKTCLDSFTTFQRKGSQ